MDKQKAYEIINQALAQIITTRQNHSIFIDALNALMVQENKSEESLELLEKKGE